MKPPILVADLFCGAGGASTGLHRAAARLGLKTNLLAVNHWPTAIETHTLNHPDVRHLCESLERVDPCVAVPGGRLQLLIAAPECTFFSTARGGRPVNDQQRAQPWLILKWLQELYVENLLLENVPEFEQWGPVGAHGKPLKSRRGSTFQAFLESIRSLDYRVEYRILNAADYGDPTTRRRLFVIARRGKRAIAWPTPSHSKTGASTLFGKTEKWRAAREVIDWSVPSQSIFNRKRPLSPRTMARIMAGLERFGGDELKPFLIIMRRGQTAQSIDGPVPTITAHAQQVGVAEPFLMPVTHGSDSSKRERSIDDPLPTVTGANRGELALCEPIIVPNNQNNRAKTLDEPLPTVTGGGRHMLVEPFVLQQQSGGAPRDTSQPLPTIACDGAQMLVEPFMVNLSHGQRLHDVAQPVPTITTAKGGELAVVEPYIISVAHGDNAPGSGRGNGGRVRSVDEPMPAVTASGKDYAVVEPFIVPPRGFSDGPVDSVDQPLRTIAAAAHTFAVVEPFLVPNYGERPGQEPRTHSVAEPVPVIPASGGGKFGLVEPFIAEYHDEREGEKARVRSVDEPLATITTENRYAVAEPFVLAAGSNGAPRPTDQPLPTIVGAASVGLVQPSFIASYYGTQNISPVTEPLPTVTTKDRFALVLPTVNGRSLDIRLRMLKPHELAKAMSFPDDYQFAGNQGDKVKQVGNAWACRLGEALIRSLIEEYAARVKRTRLEGVA